MNALWVIPLGAFMNWFVRGGGVESALLEYRSLPGLKILNALVYGICFGMLAHDVFGGIWSGLMMIIGQMPGWGGYIAEMHGNRPWRGVLKMSGRGLFWAFCLSVGFAVYSTQLLAVGVALSGSLMGPVYYGCIRLFRGRGNEVFNEWTVAEMIFGALLWSPLALL